MPDAERLQAKAEDAQIRSEMARSRLDAALSNLSELGIRWAESKDRGSIATPAGPPDRLTHGRTDS